MISISRRGRSATRIAFGVSGQALAAALALTAFAMPAMAQDDTSAPDDQDQEEIVVSGYAASLQSAVQEKKNRDQVVESVSAEDIGKLPDASIAESIARLPGLTSQRVSGRSNSISIRGFSPDFSTTLLNGREQTSTGDNRAVEYDQYPSEIINQVLVYKTPMASVIGQGLSGTVDLRTIRPLEYGKKVLSIGARGTYAELGKLNTGSKDLGWRVNATWVDQFANDTIGVALSASYLDEPYQIQEFNSWGYPGTNLTGSPVVIGGSKSYITSTELTRLGLQGTIEARLAPELTMTWDGFYSDFQDDQIKRGIELPLWWGTNTPLSNATVQDGQVVSGTFSNVEGVVRNDAFQRHAKLYSFGWNTKYEGDDGWNLEADVSYSKTDRNELVLETYAGTARGQGNGALDTIGFVSGPTGTVFTHQLDYGDYNLIKLTAPLGWGGDQTGVDGTRIINGQDGYYNNRIIKDELAQMRGQVEKELDGSFISLIRGGVNYTHRTKSLTPDEYFVGLKANTNGTVDVPVPQEFRLAPSQLGYLGLGSIISYDPVALVNSGIFNLVANPYGDVVVKAYDIDEKLLTGYLQANLEADVGAAQLTGNFGVQVVHTDQSSNGAQASYLGTNPNGSPNIAAVKRNDGATYTDVLPSLNLSLRFPSDWVIRVGLARETIRPRLDDLKATVSYGVNIAGSMGVVQGGSGNPHLRPWRANSADVTIEKYFGQRGYVAIQGFYKDLKSYIYNQDQPYDFTGLPIQDPGPGVTVNYHGTMNVPINGQGGHLYGVELAGTIPFGEFIHAIDGFGVTGGFSYTKTRISPNPGAPPEDIPGYSKWVANGTAYFEKWGFSARGSIRYRSTFVGEVSGFGASRVRRRALPETIIDAQIGYEFQPGTFLQNVSVFLQGQNLTDERFATQNPNAPLQIIDYQIYGRRFLMGATLKF